MPNNFETGNFHLALALFYQGGNLIFPALFGKIFNNKKKNFGIGRISSADMSFNTLVFKYRVSKHRSYECFENFNR